MSLLGKLQDRRIHTALLSSLSAAEVPQSRHEEDQHPRLVSHAQHHIKTKCQGCLTNNGLRQICQL